MGVIYIHMQVQITLLIHNSELELLLDGHGDLIEGVSMFLAPFPSFLTAQKLDKRLHLPFIVDYKRRTVVQFSQQRLQLRQISWQTLTQ
jgi:hypothetical protein